MKEMGVPAIAGKGRRHPQSGGKGGRLYRFSAYLRKHWFLYLLMLPGFCFMAVFNYGPMYGILLAFKDYSPRLGVLGSPWAGLEHFQRMFADPNFIRAFKNTIIINIYNLIFGFTFAIFLALMINEIKLRKVKSVVQTCVYLPYFLSWVIFAGLVQVFLEYPTSADIGGASIRSSSGWAASRLTFSNGRRCSGGFWSSPTSSKHPVIPPSSIWRRWRA